MIEFDRVAKRYADRVVVEEASFVVREGETFVLLGRSGSGKTTTLKMMNRLVEPTSGVIRIGGVPIDARPAEALRRSIGYVIQDVGLFPHYTVRENVAVVPELLGWGASRVQKRVDELLEHVGLPPARYGNAHPHELSGGQQQRVGLARALAADPPIVLLDEPFAALDPLTRRDMQREFFRLSENLGKTMVLVTHDVAEAVTFGDRICLFESGKIQQLGTPSDLVLRPSNDFVRTFFDTGRTELELRVVSLSDLAPDLRRRGPDRADASVDLPATTSIHDALTDPHLSNGAACRVRDEHGLTLAVASRATLLDSFFHLRDAELHG
jgi:osmoprotectant transport system ATP-binding protein